MQQYLTLEEAAKLLHTTADELREMAKKKTIRAFQDRGTWRFRLQDVEEEARKRGLGSDPELRLSDAGQPAAKSDRLAADFSLDDDEVPLGREKPSAGPRSSRTKSPRPGSDSDVRLVLDEGAVSFDADLDAGPKSVGPRSSASRPRPGKRQSRLDSADSGVRLVGADDPSDSDVKVPPSGVNRRPGGPKQESDSDVRLDDLPSKVGKKKGKEANIITEEIDLDAEEARQADRGKPGKGKKERKGTMMAGSDPLLPTESPFELSDPDMGLGRPPAASSARMPKRTKPAVVDDSSDFEMVAFDASKSPNDLGSGEIPILGDDEVGLGSEVAGGHAGNSGINLADLDDGGISLEGSDGSFDLSLDDEEEAPRSQKSLKGGKPAPAAADDSSSEFELSLDDSDASGSSEFELSVDGSDESGSSEFELSLDASDESAELSGVQPNSDSEFELTLDDDGGLAEDGGKDLFEETNFDVPALEDDSGSEAVPIDGADTDLEGSDFDISLDEDSSTGDDSGSAVVDLDEEGADEGAATVAKAKKPAKKGKAAAAVDDDEELDLDADVDEEEEPAPKGKKGKKKKPVAVEEDEEDEEDDERRPAAAAPANWGALPTVLLLPTVMVLFVVGLMGFELVRGMWGYHRATPVGRPVIDAIAGSGIFGDPPPK